jgi:hypothetical protein
MRTLLLQAALLRFFCLLAEAAPDVVPTSTILGMAEQALLEVTESLDPVALHIVGVSFQALDIEGVLREEHLEHAVSLCIKALQIWHGALPNQPDTFCIAGHSPAIDGRALCAFWTFVSSSLLGWLSMCI